MFQRVVLLFLFFFKCNITLFVYIISIELIIYSNLVLISKKHKWFTLYIFFKLIGTFSILFIYFFQLKRFLFFSLFSWKVFIGISGFFFNFKKLIKLGGILIFFSSFLLGGGLIFLIILLYKKFYGGSHSIVYCRDIRDVASQSNFLRNLNPPPVHFFVGREGSIEGEIKGFLSSLSRGKPTTSLYSLPQVEISSRVQSSSRAILEKTPLLNNKHIHPIKSSFLRRLCSCFYR